MSKKIHDPQNPDCVLYQISSPAADNMFGCSCHGGTLLDAAKELELAYEPRAGRLLRDIEAGRKKL